MRFTILQKKITRFVAGAAIVASSTVALAVPSWAADRPNILVIMGDDIGIPNISIYSHGMMGYQTPNLDRLAREGALFTDYYGENSCTAGRSAFITGQHVIRTGLSKVGLPGSDFGIRPEDPTLGDMLRAEGYATGQFGKNHFGDRDEHLPTNHGFDEFFGNLYHMNAEEEPENEDWPDDPAFNAAFSPRGVLHSTVDGEIEDTGPLTAERMETVDDEFMAATMDFIDRNHEQDKPWFAWFNTTRMHFYTHVRDENRGRSGLNEYADGMHELDDQVGLLMAKLEDLGIADNTIVIFTTDNGVHQSTWPDAGVTWFRNEKTTNWEGGFRVPAMVRYPGHIQEGMVVNNVMSHLDWVPTIMSYVGVTDIKERLMQGYEMGGTNYRVHLDGYDFTGRLAGETTDSPRPYYIYASDAAEITAIRFNDRWKAIFMEQQSTGNRVWIDNFTPLKAPLLMDLRMDPFEKAIDTSNTYYEWWMRRVFLLQQGGAMTAQFVRTFVEYPPRQRPPSLDMSEIMEPFYRDE